MDLQLPAEQTSKGPPKQRRGKEYEDQTRATPGISPRPSTLLFYINTLAPSLPKENTNSFFADDITILSEAKTLKEAEKKIQKAVDIVAAWAKEYKMDLSTKSEIGFFTTNDKEAKWRPKVKIGESTVKFEPSPRLLGVFLDRTLAFTKHTETVVEKVGKKCRMLGAVANSEWGWRKKELTKIYNAQVRPVMDYGAAAWQPWICDSLFSISAAVDV